jgi:hypothetical protein
MKGILIDPAAKTVTDVEVGPPSKMETLHDVYELMECDTIQPVYLDQHNVMYVDEEGLMKKDPGPFFGWHNYAQPLCGRCLVLGYKGGTYEDTDVNMTRDEVEQAVTWLNIEFVGYADIDINVKDGFMIGKRAIFRQLGPKQ